MPGPEDTEDTTQANAVNIKPPAFMETAAPAWFSIIEAQFHLRNITAENTKFFSIIAALPPEVISRLPPTSLELASSNYQTLKEGIISMYEKTKPELLDRLMKTTSISGRPSVYLQEMINTASRIGVTDDIIRHKFLQALPSTISPVIASQKELNLSQLGNLADELLPYFSQSPVMAAPQQKPRHSNVQSTEKTDSNPTHFGVRPFNKDQRPKVCRAHIYFADRARTCKPWCKWPNKANCQMQPSSRPSTPTPSEN